MSRVIKFRGKVEGRWWYATPDDDSWEQFWALVDRETVGMFTGLTQWSSKGGIEVYEGDLAESDFIVAEDGRRKQWEVYWRDQFAGFYFRDVGKAVNEEQRWIDLLHGGNIGVFEVVGNVYDTPDQAER